MMTLTKGGIVISLFVNMIGIDEKYNLPPDEIIRIAPLMLILKIMLE